MNKKQRVFVEEYLQCWNATEAARRAGYSERTARTQGSKLLTKVDIAEEISKRISEIAMSADEVLVRLAEQARVSLGDIVTIYGKGKDAWYLDLPKVIEEGKGHLIKSLVPTQYGLKVELHDKQKALELLGRHHQLFTDKLDVTSGGEKIKAYISISPDDWDDGED